MRSILVLFAIAALGFIFILQKKDAPEATTVKTKPAKSHQVNQVSQHNSMKHSLDKAHAVAQNVAQTRKEERKPIRR
jgi:hypothetical protein